MKLSKQERIAVIVVVILLILVAGAFLFIKPSIETIVDTKSTLSTKQKEYDEALAKQEQKAALRDSVLEAYNKGKNTADRFFSELSAYEADNEFREFLSTCEANVLVEDLQVSAPATAGLSASMFVPEEVQYALKEYVNQGNRNTTEFDPRLVRQTSIMLILGEAQTIGATTVSFTLKATTLDDILKFADEVNNYTKNENGTSVRKSLELSTIDFTDNKTVAEYRALAENIRLQAEAKAAEIFEEKTGSKLNGYTETSPVTPTPTPGDDPENPGTGSTNRPGSDDDSGIPLNYYYFEMPCSITFYSIERMQDPTPVLDEQDELVTAS